MSSTVKKVAFLIFLGFFAVIGSASLIWFTNIYPSMNADKPFESPTYAASIGASKYENIQERRDGKNTTTLQFTIEPKNFNTEIFFTKIQEDIEKLDETELVNIELIVGTSTNTTFAFNYYPSSPENYSGGKFKVATDMFAEGIEKSSRGYTFTVTERGDASNIDVSAKTQWIDWDGVTGAWKELLDSTQEFYPLVPGSGTVYNVKYENLRTVDAQNEVASTIQTTFTSQMGLDRLNSRDFGRLKDVADQRYDYLHFEDIIWTIYPETLPLDEQIVFVIADKGGALNDALATFQNENKPARPLVPASSEYVFRYTPQGENLAVFPSYYMKQ